MVTRWLRITFNKMILSSTSKKRFQISITVHNNKKYPFATQRPPVVTFHINCNFPSITARYTNSDSCASSANTSDHWKKQKIIFCPLYMQKIKQTKKKRSMRSLKQCQIVIAVCLFCVQSKWCSTQPNHELISFKFYVRLESAIITGNFAWMFFQRIMHLKFGNKCYPVPCLGQTKKKFHTKIAGQCMCCMCAKFIAHEIGHHKCCSMQFIE